MNAKDPRSDPTAEELENKIGEKASPGYGLAASCREKQGNILVWNIDALRENFPTGTSHELSERGSGKELNVARRIICPRLPKDFRPDPGSAVGKDLILERHLGNQVVALSAQARQQNLRVAEVLQDVREDHNAREKAELGRAALQVVMNKIDFPGIPPPHPVKRFLGGVGADILFGQTPPYTLFQNRPGPAAHFAERLKGMRQMCGQRLDGVSLGLRALPKPLGLRVESTLEDCLIK